jgi:AcrR family transcriptional regulator
MVIRQRAILEEDKLQRRQAILDAAQVLLLQSGDELASVEEVARQAGLAKGTVYLYFRSKEEVYLAVHEQRAHKWFDTLDALLADEGARPDLARFTRRVCEALSGQPGFLILGVQCPALERNVDPDELLRMKAGIAQRLEGTGGTVERAFRGLPVGEGARLLIRSYGLMLGLWQLKSPTPLRARLLQHRALEVFASDYLPELEVGLFALWQGTLAASRQSAAARSA